MKNIVLLLLLFALSMWIVACDTAVSDADLTTAPALATIDFKAESDDIVHKVVTVSGTVTLGYTSNKMVDIKIVDNEIPLYMTSVPADSLTLSFTKDVVLSDNNENNLSVIVSYNGQSVKQSLMVNLPSSVQSFTLKSDKTTVDQFSVGVSGEALFGYLSNHPAHLSILVNDAVIYTENIDVSKKLKYVFSTTIPLSSEGNNSVVGRIEYDDSVVAKQVSVIINTAISSFTLSPSKTPVDIFSVTLTGSATFGFISDKSAVLEVFVNGEKLYAENVNVSSELSHQFSFDVPLNGEGDNMIVAKLSYGKSTQTQQFTVAVNAPIFAFALAPETSVVDTFSASVSGSAIFGYLSNIPAVLTVAVNGETVYADNIDVSKQLEHNVAFVIPLSKEGSNEVVATLSYGKNRQIKQFAVSVNNAIVAFDCAPALTTVDNYSVTVDGSIDFGYFSTQKALLSVSVNDEDVYSETIAVTDALHKDFSLNIPLTDAGQNRIVVSISYGEGRMAQTFVVTVDNSVKSFDITPVSAGVDAFVASLSGSIVFGHVADTLANLTVTANGTSVYSRDIAVNTTADFNQTLAFDISLPEEGDNLIVATITYDGVSISKQMTVTVNDAVTAFSVAPVLTVLNDFSVDMTGDISFGYTSSQPAQLSITANSRKIYSESIDVSTDLSHHIMLTLPLADEGENIVVATVSYGSVTLTKQFSVVIEPAVKTFTLSPAASTVGEYSATLTGAAEFGYRSDNPAHLTLFVNGKLMYEEDFSVATNLNQGINVTLPLDTDGNNEITATLSYGSISRSQKFTVSVDPTAPTASFPGTWSKVFASNVMTVSGDAVVTSDNPLKQVSLSVDGGAFIPQPVVDNGDGTFTVSLETTNPDIGISTVTLKVDSVVNGREHSYLFNDTFKVDAVFNCGDGGSMSPETLLLQDNSREIRTMLGYFGKSDGGHNVAFVIKGKSSGDTYTVQGWNRHVGYTAVETEFLVEPFKCSSWPFPYCDIAYSLTVLVDGTQLCSEENFGIIRNYH